jgi:4-hydroxy-3-polyprenylbenzoate decarboxylase
MGYRSFAHCLRDLERTGQLVRIEREVDPDLEAAAIHRRVYRAGGPGLYFPRVKGTPFPMASNLFGTLDRAKFLFRDTLDAVRRLVDLKVEPNQFFRRPWRYRSVPRALWNLRPKLVQSGPVLANRTTVSQLPQLKCWPMDGGPFITLPQVYTEDPDRPGWRRSNLGMYRVQLSGNDYVPDHEVGLHYQIHRGIGVHHAAAVRRGEPLRVAVTVGGPPALAVAAVMPLPEGMPEVAFAGALGGRRVRMVKQPNPLAPFPKREGGVSPSPFRGGVGEGLPFPADADFVLTGTIDPTRTKPEGPFGDHLGYYSLKHDFPVMTVEAVYHREGAVWPFTVVGRPPQEDTTFGQLIHELIGPVIPTVIPGLHAVHAVDTAGVHPLLLALGSERYVPYATTRKPQELLTLANAILGQGQLSLAKYLFVAAKEDDPSLDVHDVPAFFRHVLERVDWRTDLHFQTATTIDTLDYSAGEGLNAGSKLVIAVAGPKRRALGTELPPDFRLPPGLTAPRVVAPGILAVEATPEFRPDPTGNLPASEPPSTLSPFPLLVLVDDSAFTAERFDQLLWVTFTRSNPATDVLGVGASIRNKHWGCDGPLVIDARLKSFMPPPLEEDPAVERRIDDLFTRGGPLAKWGG